MKLGPRTSTGFGEKARPTQWIDTKPVQKRTRKSTAIEVGYRVLLPIAIGTLANLTLGNHGLVDEAVLSLIAAGGINGGKYAYDIHATQSRRMQAYAEQHQAGVAVSGKANEDRKLKELKDAARREGAETQRREGTLMARFNRARRSFTE